MAERREKWAVKLVCLWSTVGDSGHTMCIELVPWNRTNWNLVWILINLKLVLLCLWVKRRIQGWSRGISGTCRYHYYVPVYHPLYTAPWSVKYNSLNGLNVSMSFSVDCTYRFIPFIGLYRFNQNCKTYKARFVYKFNRVQWLVRKNGLLVEKDFSSFIHTSKIHNYMYDRTGNHKKHPTK